MSEARDFVLLMSIGRLTETKLHGLLDRFKTPQAIMHANIEELSPIAGNEVARLIVSLKIDDDIERIIDIVEKQKIQIIPFYSSQYPQWLGMVEHAPPVLFMRGSLQPEDEIAVAIIGTRGATVYGKNIAENFAGDFAESGVTVVSGMARGIDTAAHWGALRRSGRTVAVLGCGLDRVYPPENRELMEEITRNGAVVSEFYVGTPPLAQNFPKRNRIISGLSKAVVAIEAKEKSGVMNTVNWALNQNKDVFAIPGNIYAKTSSGTNRLIKEGATPATSAGEIMEALGIKYAKKERELREVILENEEKSVWETLSLDPIYLDELSERLNLATPVLLKILLGLEIKGLVRQLPGMMFVKKYE